MISEVMLSDACNSGHRDDDGHDSGPGSLVEAYADIDHLSCRLSHLADFRTMHGLDLVLPIRQQLRVQLSESLAFGL